jgi:phthiodiolone/phenolphthiodiolone dimycocerosates ketoreductase
LKVKFGLSAIAYEIKDFIDQAVDAEQNGFDSVWVADHFTDLPPSNDKYDPWPVLAAIGMKTQKILLGTLATDCARRHPALISHAAATLDNLTAGRAILGIGAGEAMNLVPYGLPWEEPDIRVARLEEAVKVIRLLWKSTFNSPVNFQGRFYHLKDARLDLHPHNDRNLPVYIASLGSKRSLRLTGKLADGWLPWFNTAESFIERSKIVDEMAVKTGRSPGDIEKVAVVYLALTSDRGKEKRVLDSMKPEIVVLTGGRRLTSLGYKVDSDSGDYSYQKCLASEDDAEEARRLGSGIPDDLARRFLVVGDPDRCVDRLQELVGAGAQHLIIRDMLWANRMEDFHHTLKVVGRDIIPSFS